MATLTAVELPFLPWVGCTAFLISATSSGVGSMSRSRSESDSLTVSAGSERLATEAADDACVTALADEALPALVMVLLRAVSNVCKPPGSMSTWPSGVCWVVRVMCSTTRCARPAADEDVEEDGDLDDRTDEECLPGQPKQAR